jgi:hypothetical protein
MLGAAVHDWAPGVRKSSPEVITAARNCRAESMLGPAIHVDVNESKSAVLGTSRYSTLDKKPSVEL